jgi:predicted TIM-barrel fold metal-dependent hydrolase
MFVDLDGGWGEALLQKHLDLFKAKEPDRFQIFGGVDWAQWQTLGAKFPEWAAKRLKVQKEWGAQGLKIWKPFGLSVRDEKGELVKIDDARLDPLWQTAGEVGLPVMIHIADPVAFFDPIDEHNERWEELGEHPDWAFTSPPYPPFTSLVEAFARLVERHPQTTFIGAHVGCYAENLGWVASVIQRTQNFYVDISARSPELGRQPYSARRFFIENQDRILFGTDHPADAEAYRAYYRFLESDDEYFAYDTDPEAIPAQGRWRIYGLHLPDAVLEKVYWKNAERVLKTSNL